MMNENQSVVGCMQNQSSHRIAVINVLLLLREADKTGSQRLGLERAVRRRPQGGFEGCPGFACSCCFGVEWTRNDDWYVVEEVLWLYEHFVKSPKVTAGRGEVLYGSEWWSGK